MDARISISLLDGCADVRPNRGDKMNARDAAMFEALVSTAEKLQTQKGLRAVVLSGEGRAFCAGLDTSRFAAMSDGGESKLRDLTTRTHGLANHSQQAVWGWRQLPVPVFAAIYGVAFGGGFEVSLGADVRSLATVTRVCIMVINCGVWPVRAGT